VTCLHDHWRRGHEQVCGEIHRGGGAEQYHADKKYIRDAMNTLDDTARTARRVLGSAHPVTAGIYVELRDAQAALRDRLVFLYDVELNARSSS